MTTKEGREAVESGMLSHPLRRQVLTHISEKEAAQSPSNMAGELGQPLGNVSYHVRQLADTGLLKITKRMTRRGAVEHFYDLTPRGKELVTFIATWPGS